MGRRVRVLLHLQADLVQGTLWVVMSIAQCPERLCGRMQLSRTSRLPRASLKSDQLANGAALQQNISATLKGRWLFSNLRSSIWSIVWGAIL